LVFSIFWIFLRLLANSLYEIQLKDISKGLYYSNIYLNISSIGYPESILLLIENNDIIYGIWLFSQNLQTISISSKWLNVSFNIMSH